MADAIVLITTESDMVSEAAKRIVELEGVQDVYSVAGDVDLVAVVSTDHFEDLTSVIPEGIAKVDGVVGTQTLMAFRTYSREDEQAAFDLGGEAYSESLPQTLAAAWAELLPLYRFLLEVYSSCPEQD